MDDNKPKCNRSAKWAAALGLTLVLGVGVACALLWSDDKPGRKDAPVAGGATGGAACVFMCVVAAAAAKRRKASGE